MTARHPCPACGFLVFDEPAGSYDICPVCGWEDDAVQLRHPGLRGGANGDSLAEWQQRVLPRWPPAVRTAEGFARDPKWRPLAPNERQRAADTAGTGQGCFEAAAEPEPPYYWREDDH